MNDKESTLDYLNNLIKDYRWGILNMKLFITISFLIILFIVYCISCNIYSLINCEMETFELVSRIIVAIVLLISLFSGVHASSEAIELIKESERNIDKVKQTISDIENDIIK